MSNSNVLLVSGGLLMSVTINEIYTLVAIAAIGLGILSSLITLVIKFFKFIKDGKLTKEEQQQLVDNLNKANEKIDYLQGYIDELKKGEK